MINIMQVCEKEYIIYYFLFLSLLLSTDNDENLKFKQILNQFYDFRSREFPEHATYMGEHTYDDTLHSFRLEAFDRRKVSR